MCNSYNGTYMILASYYMKIYQKEKTGLVLNHNERKSYKPSKILKCVIKLAKWINFS